MIVENLLDSCVRRRLSALHVGERDEELGHIVQIPGPQTLRLSLPLPGTSGGKRCCFHVNLADHTFTGLCRNQCRTTWFVTFSFSPSLSTSPSGWDNEKKIAILHENFQTVKADDSFEDVIIKPPVRKVQVFLLLFPGQQFYYCSNITSEPSVTRISVETQMHKYHVLAEGYNRMLKILFYARLPPHHQLISEPNTKFYY